MRRGPVLALILLALAAPLHARPLRVTTTTTTTTTPTAIITTVTTVTEEVVTGDEDAAADSALDPGAAAAADSASEADAATDSGSDRFVGAVPVPVPHGVAAYGPFRVLDGTHAALVDVTDERSPAAFSAMLAAYPRIATLELVECPGTDDDRANLRLGRMIRLRGLATHVPAGGSVRSGAVELFLAGVHHTADRGSEFAVHSWADDRGREPRDYPANAPENRAYIDYYQAMGMSPIEARAFYDMTNSVPNASARWLTAAQMGQWVRLN